MTLFSLDESLIQTALSAVASNDGGSRAERGMATTAGSGSGSADVSSSPSASEGEAAFNTDDDARRAVMIDRFARASWSGIAEPGDVVAGVLVQVLGAGAALTTLVERHSRSRIMTALEANGSSEISPADLGKAIDRWMPRLVSNAVLTSLRQAAACGAMLVVPGDRAWPEEMSDLGEHQPHALWVRGSTEALRRLSYSVALIGARAASGYGEHVAMELAAGLSDRGVGVVSGAAYGIDGMAHRATLASNGVTGAFLAGGVDRFYPSGHDSLLERIIDTGAVISELPCGSPPTKWRFLQRNRLIAALSLATVVIEAGTRSGSLNTAAHAASLGRPLGAVPGPVTSASSAGCHRMLREFGADCITSTDDVMELIAGLARARSGSPDHRPSDEVNGSGGEPESSGSDRAGSGGDREGSGTDREGVGDQVGEGRASARKGRRADVELAQGTDRASGRSAEHVRLLDALSKRSPRATGDVARRAGLSIARTSALLGELGVVGDVLEVERGWKKIEP